MPRLLTLLLLAAAALPAAAQSDFATLTVIVRDQASGEPVSNATVQIAGVSQAGRTNGAGTWRAARIPAGNRIVEVSRIGYARARQAIEFAAGQGVERTITLAPAPVEVAEIAAEGERRSAALETRGFYERQRRGHGAFMTHERIAQLHPVRTVEIFYHMRGFAVKRDRRGQPYVVTSRGGANLSMDCTAPLIFLDGTQLSGGSSAFDFITPESIAAIEAYSGPSSTPQEYRLPGAACGVILVWTRVGDEP